MPCSSLPSFLAGFFGMLGALGGVIVSNAAHEELKSAKKTFSLLAESLFLFTAGLFFFQAGFIILVLSLLLCGTVLHAFRGQEQGKLIAFMTIILLVLTFDTSLFPLIAGCFFVIGLIEGGLWCAHHEKMVCRGLLRQELWQAFFQDHSLYLILPFAGLIFLL
ncbi:hypothetical protein GF367_04595 [Candidatus Woesearchaeota archaeon]|nr:hypothetical protein [Candidatus Woesearchaeota archaeon]